VWGDRGGDLVYCVWGDICGNLVYCVWGDLCGYSGYFGGETIVDIQGILCVETGVEM